MIVIILLHIYNTYIPYYKWVQPLCSAQEKLTVFQIPGKHRERSTVCHFIHVFCKLMNGPFFTAYIALKTVLIKINFCNT